MYTDWSKLKEDCLQCRRCGLCQTRTNLVFGVGNPNARVLFIGEGPGANEDLRGEPFVGRAGQLLDMFLEIVDLDRKKNIYIANMVKCRPPENRDPKPEEQDECIFWLREQTRLIKPAIIVCLGRISALRLIDPELKISRQHGEFFEKNKTIMMPMYHPAAILRNPRLKADALADFQKLRDKIKEVCPETYERDNYDIQ